MPFSINPDFELCTSISSRIIVKFVTPRPFNFTFTIDFISLKPFHPKLNIKSKHMATTLHQVHTHVLVYILSELHKTILTQVLAELNQQINWENWETYYAWCLFIAFFTHLFTGCVWCVIWRNWDAWRRGKAQQTNLSPRGSEVNSYSLQQRKFHQLSPKLSPLTASPLSGLILLEKAKGNNGLKNVLINYSVGQSSR